MQTCHVSTRAMLVGIAIALAPLAVGAQDTSSTALVSFESEGELSAFLRDMAGARPRRGMWAPSVPCELTASAAIDSSAIGSGPAVLRGRVRRPSGTDATTDGLVGASVTIAPLGLGATTGSDGAFEVTVPAESLATARQVTVTARRIGYRPQSVAVLFRQGEEIELDLPLCTESLALSEMVVTGIGTAGAEQSVTNTQHAGVDEGGIVKRHGDYLVILRRGRLFTVDVGGNRLQPVSNLDAFAPDIDPAGDWYDEMLVVGNRVVVIGYSYARGGTELGLFRISPTGQLQYEATYHLRSNDYYSSENYAARIVGTRLVVYSPLYVGGDTANPLASLPAMRRWQPATAGAEARTGRGEATDEFRSTVSARRVFRPAGPVELSSLDALHTVTSCDLAAREFACESTVVLGGSGRVFYVSPTAVYVAAMGWRAAPPAGEMRTGHDRRSEEGHSALYRIPLDGSPPAVIRVAGMPIDQFSFLERDEHLNLVLQAQGRGDGMWGAELPAGALSLLRLSLMRFTDGTAVAPSGAYRPLPAVDVDLAIQNRFVGDHLLYGAGNSWWSPTTVQPTLLVVPVHGGEIARLPIRHGVDRIEVLGQDAIVIGSDTADLYFTAVRLGRQPRLAQRYVLKEASQGELRSHGFFYRPDPHRDRAGSLGLPVARPGRPGYEHLFEGSAAILFLRNERGMFRPLGELAARPERAVDDGCKASCVDWYGNARPLFIDGRVFALLGYEVVEGRVRAGRIREVRRVSFAPRISSRGEVDKP